MKLHRVITKPRLLGLLLLASVASSFAGHRTSVPLRRLARLALEPVADGGVYLATVAGSSLQAAGGNVISPKDARALADENERLRGALIELSQRLGKAERENREIQDIHARLYRPNDDMPSELIPARVVALDPLPYSATRVLDQGTPAGARPGLPVTTRGILTNRAAALPTGLAVMTASSLVGRVTDADAYTARLQLLTDPAYRVPVKIRRLVDGSHPRTITVMRDGLPVEELLTLSHPDVEVDFPGARGDGVSGMVIENVKSLHNICAGDLVYTRAADMAVGAEIPVGRVSEVEDDSRQPGFVTVRIQPYAEMTSLREVYIVIPPRGGFSEGGDRP
jgi:cell shape-determining protein MreC